MYTPIQTTASAAVGQWQSERADLLSSSAVTRAVSGEENPVTSLRTMTYYAQGAALGAFHNTPRLNLTTTSGWALFPLYGG